MAEKKRILIIDDEPDFVYTLRVRLEHEGFEVLEAGDGLAGLEVLLKEEVDLILLDVMMPRMDGFTFLRTIKEESSVYSVPPVIVLTAYARKIDEEKRRLLGDIPVIGKTFEYKDLYAHIVRLLSGESGSGASGG